MCVLVYLERYRLLGFNDSEYIATVKRLSSSIELRSFSLVFISVVISESPYTQITSFPYY